MKYEACTEEIIGAFYDVYNALGYGFLEKVYENSMAIELRRRGLSVSCQYPIGVVYRGEIVGSTYADLLVQDCVIVELKAARQLVREHQAQLLNCLNATRYCLTLHLS